MDYFILFLKVPLTLIILLVTGSVHGQWQQELIRQRDPRVFTHVEMLDPDNKYQLEWVVNWAQKRISFNVTVATRGFVMFGLSQNGSIKGADLIIGGVSSRGKSYFTDRFGVSDQVEPVIDTSQDWDLHFARETRTHTILSFSRAFDTCDKSQYHPINEFDGITLLWAYGQSDHVLPMNRITTRGTYPVYLLDPNLVPRSIKESTFTVGPPSQAVLAKENLKLWTVSTSMRLPEGETFYQCTIHRGLRSSRKQHMVGFRTRLDTPSARRHTHHILFYRCIPPEGTDASETYEQLVNSPGESCYFSPRPLGNIPTQYCNLFSFGYAYGARIAFFPDHVGLPFAESPNEYYLLQVHYDNIDKLPNVQIDVHLDMYYTDKLRPNEAGVLMLGHNVPAATSLLVPPTTSSQRIFGHCGSACTDAMFPEEGVNLYFLNMHTHLSGKRVHVRHFRGDLELPWLTADSNYNSGYQEFRILKKEAKIKRGDHLMIQCDMDSTWTNGTVNGGFATRNEMCLSFMWYYNRLPRLLHCRSDIRDARYLKHYLLGLQNVTWSFDKLDFVATSPAHLEGLSIREISDMVEWTSELRAELQQDHINLPQYNVCPQISPITGVADDRTYVVTRPRDVVEWIPPTDNTCELRNVRKGQTRRWSG